MSTSKGETGAWEAANLKNSVRLACWTAAWVVTMAVANLGPGLVWEGNRSLTALAILVNVVIGFGMILANIRHLKGLDELQQRIQLDAMGLALGIGLVVGLAYANLARTDIIPFTAQISHLVILMVLTYMAGIFFGLRRYR